MAEQRQQQQQQNIKPHIWKITCNLCFAVEANQYVTCMVALMLYVPFNIFSITTSVFLLSSLVDPVLSRLYKSVLLKVSKQCPDESRTSDPRSPLSKWKIKKILIKCRTDWKNYRHTRSGYIPTCRSSRPYCGIFFFLMLIFQKLVDKRYYTKGTCMGSPLLISINIVIFDQEIEK